MPRLCGFYPGICLTTEEEARKNLSQGSHGRVREIAVRRLLTSSCSSVRSRPHATTGLPLDGFSLNLVFEYFLKICKKDRLRWSRGSVLAFGTQVRGFKPGRSRRIFKGEKILSTPSFGGDVKPSVPYRRFAACKRSLELRGSRILDEICRNISRPRRVPPSAARGLSRRWT